MLKLLNTFLFCSILFCCNAQRITAEQYIEQYKDIAISEMKRSGVPAAVTLAQGLLETESGNSELVKKSNNHFGIKCKDTWTGASVTHDDDYRGECFRAYENAADSYKDHSDFLHGNIRYSFLFKLDATDYKGWAYGLKRAGYATNPQYPQILINNIEQYNLQQYTLFALQEPPIFDSSKNNHDKTIAVKDNLNVVNHNIVNVVNHPVDSVILTDKIIFINKCKAVVAKKGTSLLAIATRNNINLVKLLEYNDLAKDGLLAKDQYIYLQQKSKIGEPDFYISLPGETLYDVAQKNAIVLQCLADYNATQIVYNNIQPGTKLFLKPGLKIINTEKIKLHVVKPKEGLYSIAREYNVTVQQLKEWNKLSSDDLKTGQEIIVSK